MQWQMSEGFIKCNHCSKKLTVFFFDFNKFPPFDQKIFARASPLPQHSDFFRIVLSLQYTRWTPRVETIQKIAKWPFCTEHDTFILRMLFVMMQQGHCIIDKLDD